MRTASGDTATQGEAYHASQVSYWENIASQDPNGHSWSQMTIEAEIENAEFRRDKHSAARSDAAYASQSLDALDMQRNTVYTELSNANAAMSAFLAQNGAPPYSGGAALLFQVLSHNIVKLQYRRDRLNGYTGP